MSAPLRSTNEANFQAEVLAAPGPVLVEFWDPACSPSRNMLSLAEEIAEDYAGDVTVIGIDVQANPGAAVRFDARTIPDFVLFRGGTVMARVSGAVSRTRLCHFIEANLAGRG